MLRSCSSNIQNGLAEVNPRDNVIFYKYSLSSKQRSPIIIGKTVQLRAAVPKTKSSLEDYLCHMITKPQAQISGFNYKC
jgi:hypothetical protein